MASETTELLSTLERLAASTSKIDESVQRIASALESQEKSKHAALTYDEKQQLKKKDEELSFMKDYIRMKHSYDAMTEANSKQKDENIKGLEKVILQKDKLIQEHEIAILEKDKSITEKDFSIHVRNESIQKKDTHISAINTHIHNLKREIAANGTQIATLKETITSLNKGLNREAEQHWAQFFEKVMDEVERVENGTSCLSKKSPVWRGARRFLEAMKTKASTNESLPIPILSTSQVKDGQGVKHKLEEENEIGGEEAVKRVKTEPEE